MKIVFLKTGSFSGVNKNIEKELSKKNRVTSIDVHNVLGPKTFNFKIIFNSLINLTKCIMKYKRKWRTYYNTNAYAFKIMSEYCQKKIKQIDYDLILQTQTLFLVKQNKQYYIYTDYPPNIYRFNPEDYKILQQGLYKRASKIFLTNDYTKNLLIKEGINKNKIRNIGIASNLEIEEFKKEYTKNLLFIAYNFYGYNGDLLLNTFKKVKQRIPEVSLTIIGQKIKNIPGLISYNKLPLEKLKRFYKESTIYLMPTQLGGVQTVLEAMSYECNCIISNSNYLLTDIIKDQKNGYIIENITPEKLAGKIIEILKDKEKMELIGKRAKETIENNFTWPIICKKLIK